MDAFYNKANSSDRIKLIAKRLYEDSFYTTMFYGALSICKEISKYDRDGLITFICIRGSLVTGTITASEDVDILINSKKWRRVKRHVDRLCQKFNDQLKKTLPQLTRENVFSVYLPGTPQNPYHRHELFAVNPVELEIRTTQAEQLVPHEKRRNVYEFQTNYLRKVVATTLNDLSRDSIRISEIIREVAMKDYGMDRDTAHNSTIITQARLVGLLFERKGGIQQNTIIKERNKLLEEIFENELTEIKYWMGT